LDTIEIEVQDLAERADEQRFAEAGNAFEQHMAAREHRDESAIDNFVVADDHFGHFTAHRGVGITKGLDLLFRVHLKNGMGLRRLPRDHSFRSSK
jgi:hypothetical protein